MRAAGSLDQVPDAAACRTEEDGRVRSRADERPKLDDTIARLIRHGRDREAAELGSTRVRSTTGGAPMDPIRQLDQIAPLLVGLVAGLDDEQLDAPTPCAGFNVRQVLEHMVGGATMFAAAFRGTAPPMGDLPDPVVAFPAAMDELGAALRSPGALDRMIAAPFGEVPGEVFARFVALDGLVHGWDIATATGQPYEPPVDVVAAVDAFARQAITDGMRDGETFAAEVEPPSDVSPLLRVVAFTGRQVA
jgi:uncharacterized protein (TIGR03086 family)